MLPFELRYHIRQIPFLVFSLLFFLLGLFFLQAQFGSPTVYKNGPYQLTYVLGLLSLGIPFICMVFSAQALLRDEEHKMAAIIYASPITKFPFLASRFLGMLIPSIFVFSMVLFGLWLGSLLPIAEMDRIGPNRWSYYLWPWLVLVLPNCLLISVLLFATAAFSRNLVATYVSGIAIYGLYWVCALFFNSPMLAQAVPTTPEGLAWAALLDPFGISAFLEQSQYWTPLQRNTQEIVLRGNFLWNRVLWLGITASILFFTYAFFSFRTSHKKVKSRPIKAAIAPQKISYYPVLPSTEKFKTSWEIWKHRVQMEWATMIRSRPLWLFLAFWMVILMTEFWSRIQGGGDYATVLYPSTDLLVWLIAEPLGIFGTLFLLFYSMELVHRERQVKFHDIIDSTPVSAFIVFTSKYAALSLIPIVMIISSILLGLGTQIIQGYFHFELSLYIALFYFAGLPLLLLAAAALFFQTLSFNKYLGLMLTICFLLFFHSSFRSFLGIEHGLLQFVHTPEVAYTNMNGFSTRSQVFHWFMVYNIAFVGILAWLTYGLWQRGYVSSFYARIQKAKRRWGRMGKFILMGFVLLFLSSGAFIFYNTNLLHTYQTTEKGIDKKVRYEKKYKQYAALAQPTIVAIDSEFDLFPEQESYVLKSKLMVENKTEKPIEKVWFTTREDFDITHFSLEQARLVEHDTALGVFWFELEKPLLPKEQLELQYDIANIKKGFTMETGFLDNQVVENGTYLMGFLLHPSIGYRQSFELRNNRERQKRGLEARDESHSGSDHGHHQEEGKIDWPIRFSTTISTAADQTALAPGSLVKQWKAEGRNYFRYESKSLIHNVIVYFSARYEVIKRQHKGVSVAIYYAKGHDYNVQRMLDVASTTLDYCQEQFAPYPHDHLRIAEIPAHWPFGGFAAPGIISLVEDAGFFTDLRDTSTFDVVTKRVAHEVAHQWWGHILRPKTAAGASMLVESFAKYLELIILSKVHGKQQIKHLLDQDMNRYFNGRSRDQAAEPPLYLVEHQSHIAYYKGIAVMAALHDLLGEQKLNAVLRRLLEQERPANSQDFVDALHAIAATKDQPLINDWLKKLVTYDLQIESAEYRVLANGKYQLELKIKTQKWNAVGYENEQALPFNEVLKLEIYNTHPDQDAPSNVLYSKQHLFQQNQQQISITLDQKPAWVGIDPTFLRLDKNRVNNFKAVVKK